MRRPRRSSLGGLSDSIELALGASWAEEDNFDVA